MYSIKKKEKDSKNFLRISATGFALLCDYVICDRFDDTYQSGKITIEIEELNKLNDGSKIFLNGSRLPLFLKFLLDYLETRKIKLIFIISNIEPFLDKNIIEHLLPYTIDMYICNNVYDHPNVHNLPIGLRDPENVHANHKFFTHDTIINEKLHNKPTKDILCLLCFTVNIYIPKERLDCFNLLKDKDFVTNLNYKKFEKQPSIHCGEVPVWIYCEYCNRSKYTLCPTGAGMATHRFYEALYLDSIPIVTKTNTPFDKLYGVFPCLLIDNWESLTSDLLISNYDNLYEKLKKFNNDYKNWYNNPECLLELLKNT